ncbi:MAG: hypothetical protein BWK80_12535 [Desulfobacteraceae bacterium IS3]|nr:MAG: hypothetical protein BWK80_12535 [Desulfobacteraceae bacterium IS3]
MQRLLSFYIASGWRCRRGDKFCPCHSERSEESLSDTETFRYAQDDIKARNDISESPAFVLLPASDILPKSLSQVQPVAAEISDISVTCNLSRKKNADTLQS